MLVCLLVLFVRFSAHAQGIDPVSLLIAKVIKAIDLKVQKMQNETIWLQEAQQVAEHELSRVKLQEITDWQNRAQSLYADYFKELSTVKAVVKNLPQVKKILQMQVEVTKEYARYANDPSKQHDYAQLLQLSQDIVRDLRLSVASTSLQLKDSDRVLLLYSLKDAMHSCLEAIQALNQQTGKQGAEKIRVQTDIDFLKQFNSKP